MKSQRCKAYLAVFGGFLVHLTLGTVYSFGNMNPYVVSYLRKYTASPKADYSQSTWIFAMTYFGQGFLMPVGGLVERKLGPRLTCLLGSVLMSSGVLLTSATVKWHIIPVILSYGLLFGIGCGLAYSVAIASAMAWFPKHRGLVGGIVVAGFGSGSLIFNQIQTFYINPNNEKPFGPDESKYFYQEDLLKRVPSCFLLIGGIYAVIQFIGSMMITKPTPEEDEESRELVDQQCESKSEECLVATATSEDAQVQMTPSEVLTQRDFAILWFTFFFNGQAIIFISTLYKTFGETFIDDDFFLALVGSLAAVFNSLGRIVWGELHDVASYRILMMCLTSIMAVLLMTFYLSHLAGKYMYMIWVCLLFADMSGNFALLPAAAAKAFGTKHLAVNYGMIFTGNSVACIFGAFFTTTLLGPLGLFGVFVIGAAASGLALVLTFLYRN